MSEGKWEDVCWQNDRDRRDEPASQTQRLRVPGGWLYRCMVKTVKAHDRYGMEVSMCFVPDPNPCLTLTQTTVGGE